MTKVTKKFQSRLNDSITFDPYVTGVHSCAVKFRIKQRKEKKPEQGRSLVLLNKLRCHAGMPISNFQPVRLLNPGC